MYQRGFIFVLEPDARPLSQGDTRAVLCSAVGLLAAGLGGVRALVLGRHWAVGTSWQSAQWWRYS